MTKVALVIAGVAFVAACGGKSPPPTTTTTAPPSTTASPSASPSPSEPIEEQVAEFRGSGDNVTQTFDVKPGWELRWEVEGARLAVSLVDQSGQSVAELVNQDSTGGGSVYPRQTGTYSLHITGQGDWLIRVFNHS